MDIIYLYVYSCIFYAWYFFHSNIDTEILRLLDCS
jgi:hypothetical protein